MKAHALIILTISLLVAADDPKPRDPLARKAQPEFDIHDRNGDGFLNQDEMPDDLKSDLTKWDTNRDNLISLDEFKYYFAARAQNRRGNKQNEAPPIPTIVIEEEDLDARPIVLRAGKLPVKELPDWFPRLDTDRDGQVALYEWYKAGKDIDEFATWDRNNDGYITPEEAIYKQNLIRVASAKSGQTDLYAPTPGRAGNNSTLSTSDERSRKTKRGNFKKKGPQ